MDYRLNGLNPLSYLGVNPYTPVPFVNKSFDPTTQDWQNFALGTIWLNTTTEKLWALVSLAQNKATWIQFASSAGNTETLTGNSGGAVGPTNDNINVVGDGTTLTFVGNPGTSTLTGAVSGGTDGQLLIAATAGSPSWHTLTAGTGVSIANAANSITINATGAVPLTFHTDSGDATPAANAISIDGGAGITTAGSGSTVTVILSTPVSVADGGTGDVSFTAYAPLCGGTTTTGALQSAATGISNSGYVLTSTGASSLPTWQSVTANVGVKNVICEYYQFNDASNVTGNGAKYYLGASAIMSSYTDSMSGIGTFYVGDGAGTPASFTAGVNGNFLVYVSARLTTSAAAATMSPTLLAIEETVNGVTFRSRSSGYLFNQGGGSFDGSLSCSALFNLNSGDSVKFSVTVSGDSGNDVTVKGTNGTGTPEETYVYIVYLS